MKIAFSIVTDRFWADHAPPVVIDEVQYVPELLAYAKEQIDADRRPGRWISPTPHHADGLKKFVAPAGSDVFSAVACRIGAPITLREGIRAVPWPLLA